MAGKRRRRSRSEAESPTSDLRGIRVATLSVLTLCVAGMVFLYGGTQFWASAPFFLSGLVLIAGLQGLSFLRVLRGEGRISPPLGTGVWVVLLLYILVRALIAPGVPYQAWTEFHQVGAVLLFYVAFSDLCIRGGAWKGVVSSVFLIAVLESMYAIWLHWNGSNLVLWLPRPPGYGMRASGTFICPNHFAHVLQMAMIAAVGVLATPGRHLILKLLAGYTLLIGIVPLSLSLSRSGVLGLVAGVGVVVLCKALRKGWRRTALTVAGLAGAVALLTAALWFLLPAFRLRIEQALRGNDRWSQYWPDTWNLIQAEGFWGVGPGVFRHAFEQYREHFASSHLYLDYAHNEYLHTLAEYGWGMTLFLFGGVAWVLIRLFLRGLRVEDEASAMVPITLLGVFCGTLLHAVFDFNLHITGAMLLLAMLAGAYDGYGLRLGVWNRPALPARVAKPLPLLAAALAVGLAVASIPLFLGSRAEYRMDKALKEFRVEDAREHGAAMRRWTPSHWRGWTRLGLEHRQAATFMRNPAERERLIGLSRGAYETALERNPYERVALAGLAELEMLEGDWQAALELWTRLEELAPFDPQIKVRKGQTLMRMNRVEDAVPVFEQALRMRRGDKALQRQLQHARSRLKDKERL